MYTGPSFAPIQSVNNLYGNGPQASGTFTITNTVAAAGPAVVAVAGAGVLAVAGAAAAAAYVAVVVGPVCKMPNLGRISHKARIGIKPESKI